MGNGEWGRWMTKTLTILNIAPTLSHILQTLFHINHITCAYHFTYPSTFFVPFPLDRWMHSRTLAQLLHITFYSPFPLVSPILEPHYHSFFKLTKTIVNASFLQPNHSFGIHICGMWNVDDKSQSQTQTFLENKQQCI